MANSDALTPFGFTALESEIYVFLLDHSPATGYRIAQGINKPAANTYKALQTLQSKGAILVEESSNRMCRAVPLEELMNRLQKDFENRRKQTIKDLKSAGKPPEDERVYILRSRDQALNRAREMIMEAKSVVLIKMAAPGVRSIEGTLDQAADRGLSISLLTDESITIDGVDSTWGPMDSAQVCVVTDANQTLAGALDSKGGTEVVWTRNQSLAAVHHECLSGEIAFAHIAALLAADEKRSRMQRAVEARVPLPQNRQE
jgi:predicted transcriptional regulator